MKILAIRIKNLASIDGFTEIDFTKEPLCSAGIFAITGPTGAGKSTILDALCLALYAKTPRYLQAKETGVSIQDIPGISINQGDVRGILRDGTGEGFAEVDFVGVDDARYRARWAVNRARGRIDGAMQNESLSIVNIETGIVLASKKTEACKEIERLVGLNFEQFTRSVLLAQGDFTAFLKADKDEKASLLEKLTGTHIYSEISKLVFLKYKEAETIVHELKKQLDAVDILSDDQVGEYDQRRSIVKKEIQQYENSLTLVNTAINWHERLAQLESNRQQALMQLNKATEELGQASGRIQQLNLIEQVQKIRTETDSIIATKNKLQQDEYDLQSAMMECGKWETRLSAIDKSIISATSNLFTAKNNQENAIPAINDAKELDARLSEKESQLKHMRNEVEQAKEKHQQKINELELKENELEGSAKEVNGLLKWKADNQERQPIAENISLINSKLADAKRMLENIAVLESQLEDCRKKKTVSETLVKELQEQYESSSSAIEALRLKCATLERKLDEESIHAIEIEKISTDRLYEELLSAHAYWQMLEADKNRSRELASRLTSERSSLSTALERLALTSQGLGTATEKKLSSEKRYHRAQLQVAEDVEELRSVLVEGEECPVCGSIHHPYAIEQPISNGIMMMLAEELKEDQQAFDRLYSEHIALQSQCDFAEKSIIEIECQLKEFGTKIRNQEEGWKDYSIYTVCNALLEDEVTAWILERINSTKQLQKELTGKIDAHRTNKNILEQDKQTLFSSEMRLADLRHTLDSLNKNIASLKERIEELHQQVDKQEVEYKNIVDRLDTFFVNKTWMDNWRTAPATFVDLITQFASSWNDRLDELESGNIKLKNLQKDLEHLHSVERSFKQDKENKQHSYDRVMLENNELARKRKSIFNGSPINVVENELHHAINEAQQVLDNLRLEKQTAGNEFAASNERVVQLKKSIQHHSKILEQLTLQVNRWINDFNEHHPVHLDLEMVRELLSHSHEWVQEERIALKKINDMVTQCDSIFQERALQLETHSKNKLTEQTHDELVTLRISLNEKRSSASREEMEIGIRLDQDRDNKKKAGKLLEQIKEKQIVSENWSRLNEMIGSADGKKFRQVAQEYTLDVLLGYANIHLDGLTKRYQLQRIPSTLSIQVLDRDMGDEVRTVYSLSGGESFLVSLALALGLASLSSSRMKVESLFIDEGFGSLDPTTLNIAMDALERLHNQGRKVGVISHVQEMTERIPTQIKVTKLSSGKSRIDVAGILQD